MVVFGRERKGGVLLWMRSWLEGCRTLYKAAPQIAADAVNGLNVRFRLGLRFGHVAFFPLGAQLQNVFMSPNSIWQQRDCWATTNNDFLEMAVAQLNCSAWDGHSASTPMPLLTDEVHFTDVLRCVLNKKASSCMSSLTGTEIQLQWDLSLHAFSNSPLFCKAPSFGKGFQLQD